MKHATTRFLFGYWDTVRGERAAPERADIQPGGMSAVLADTFILQTDLPDGAVYRLGGSRLCALLGKELRGTPFTAPWQDEERAETERLVRAVATDTIGYVLGLSGRNAQEAELAFEMILLPLRHRGRTEARVLGALSPAALPSWVGLVPIERFATRSIRAIQGVHGVPGRSFGQTNGDPLERRQRFTVLEGGRA